MKVRCPHCNYVWKYKGRLNSITCPNCQRKFDKPKTEINKKVIIGSDGKVERVIIK